MNYIITDGTKIVAEGNTRKEAKEQLAQVGKIGVIYTEASTIGEPLELRPQRSLVLRTVKPSGKEPVTPTETVTELEDRTEVIG